MRRGGNIFLSPASVIESIGVLEGMTVGDLGTGSAGFFTIPLAKKVGNKGIVYGVDIMQSALRSIADIARLHGLTNVRLVWSDLEKVGATDIPAGSLDMALLINTLFQTTDRAAVLREAARLTAPGKRVVIIDWTGKSDSFGPLPQQRLDQDRILKLAAQAGLVLVKKLQMGDFHFCLIFEKK